MKEITVHDFQRELDCIYEGERYSARDNGVVLRHSRSDRKPRKLDNQWTYGRLDRQRGYLYIGKIPIHRIVATAFHDSPLNTQYVVDHIDTNRQNNRPENLRWLTRLENVLKNPITLKRIEIACGSLQAFLKNPSMLVSVGSDPNFKWMRQVSRKESQACLARMHLWATNDKEPTETGALGEWLYKSIPHERISTEDLLKTSKLITQKVSVENVPRSNRIPVDEIRKELNTSNFIAAKTKGAVQRNWYTPTEFPCCPQEEKSLSLYIKNLSVDSIFAHNDFSASIVVEAHFIDNQQSIYVICKSGELAPIKPWSFAKITYEEGLFVHSSLGKFFTKDAADKQLCLARGLKWTGDTFDDCC